MADWYGASRTNYFKVTDEERYQALFKRLRGEESIEDFSDIKNGEQYHAFGAYCDIACLRTNVEINDEEDYDEDEFISWDEFLREVGQLLTRDSVFVYTIVGNEKLRYLTGLCYMVFPNGRIIIGDLGGFAHRNAEHFFGYGYDLMLDY